MQIYIREYQNDLTVILSGKGEVLGIFDSRQAAHESYLDYVDSLDEVHFDQNSRGFAA